MPHLPRKNPEVEAYLFNHDYPIVRVQKFKGALKVIRENTTERDNPQGGKRSKIRGLSSASLKRLAFLVITSPVTFNSIITLTYGQAVPISGTITKEHLNTFLVGMKRAFGRFSYVWWLEFQKRGAPHFHLLTGLAQPGEQERKTMAEIWTHAQIDLIYSNTNTTFQECIDESNKVFNVHSHPKAWEAIRKIDGAKFYVVKYASKHKQKEVPNNFSDVGRFWGNSRDVPSQEYYELDVTEMELREYLEKKGYSVASAPILPKIIIDLN